MCDLCAIADAVDEAVPDGEMTPLVCSVVGCRGRVAGRVSDGGDQVVLYCVPHLFTAGALLGVAAMTRAIESASGRPIPVEAARVVHLAVAEISADVFEEVVS